MTEKTKISEATLEIDKLHGVHKIICEKMSEASSVIIPLKKADMKPFSVEYIAALEYYIGVVEKMINNEI